MYDRRIAQWQSTSQHTEEVAAFESCSAYQLPRLLFLSHCVPNPPDKGEKIRAFHQLKYLATRYQVHLACFARNSREVDEARRLKDCCASVYVELLPQKTALVRAAMRFAAGGCLTASFYNSATMKRYINSLRDVPVSLTLAYSSAMAQYAPAGIPLILDMVDVDSEKWLQYGRLRWPGRIYRTEGERLRKLELGYAARARCTYFTTSHEDELFRSFAPNAVTKYVENGVDFDYFDPSVTVLCPELEGRRFLVFIGAMDYYPNVDAVKWFASRVFPQLKSRHPELEFLVVGRNPHKLLGRLRKIEGVRLIGGVADVRPYLSSSLAAVAPLRIARGIQNKVLEPLAMGKQVFASSAVCTTLGPELPAGITRCDSPEDFLKLLPLSLESSCAPDLSIRRAAQARFCWERNMSSHWAALEQS